MTYKLENVFTTKSVLSPRGRLAVVASGMPASPRRRRVAFPIIIYMHILFSETFLYPQNYFLDLFSCYVTVTDVIVLFFTIILCT